MLANHLQIFAEEYLCVGIGDPVILKREWTFSPGSSEQNGDTHKYTKSEYGVFSAMMKEMTVLSTRR